MGGQKPSILQRKQIPQMSGASACQKENAENGTLAVAEFQSAGKGKAGT